MKKILQLKLRILAGLILKKYQPEVIGITGSVGKTTAKEAIAAVLSSKFSVRAPLKNYNNEIGVPLTIIGADSPGSSLIGWLGVFFHAWKLLLWRNKNYPRMIILELGVDRPGDMRYLTRIAKPQVGVVTAVSHSHLEFFGSLEKIKKEKQGLIESLPSKGLAVLNADSELVSSMTEASRAKVLTYGFSKEADLRAVDLRFNYEKGEGFLPGLSFKMEYNGSSVPVFLREAISDKAVLSALSAAVVATHFSFNLVETASALEHFYLPKGRLRVLRGIKNSSIIDDTYNASPDSTAAALEVMSRATLPEHSVKIAILGEMLELGSYTEEGHRLVGKKVVAAGISQLILVGERAHHIALGAKEDGFNPENIFYFSHATEAGGFAVQRIGAGDLILVKGSQGSRMEKAILEVMAEPQRANELLVRQGQEWKNK
ncbi:MAG: Mur ligase family protein [Candidatus Falkowbacteria bacterium]|nr:Mur ligase family protein [Candidatus Falkowbacteria bacterium]